MIDEDLEVVEPILVHFQIDSVVARVLRAIPESQSRVATQLRLCFELLRARYAEGIVEEITFGWDVKQPIIHLLVLLGLATAKLGQFHTVGFLSSCFVSLATLE